MGLKDGVETGGTASKKVGQAAELQQKRAQEQVGGTAAAVACSKKESAALEALKEEETAAAYRFQEQCYLMSNWEFFTRQNKRKDGRPRAYKQFAQLEHQNPFEYNSILFKKSENADILFELRASQLSLLVPEIRLYKEYKNPKTKESFSLELPFDDLTRKENIDIMSQTRRGRGGGVGLKSFTWKSLGTNPGNKYSYGAEIVLYFQNIEDFFEVRDTRTVSFNGKTEDISLRYSDLLLPQKKFREGENEGSFTYNKDYFRFKVVSGWSVPRGVPNDFLSREVVNVLAETKLLHYLSIHNHSIVFNEDGSVQLTIEATAYSETVVQDPRSANVLFANADIEKEKVRIAKILDRQEKSLATAKKLGEQKAEEVITATIEENKERLEKINTTSKELSYQRIMEDLVAKGRIKAVLVDTDFLFKKSKVKFSRNKRYTVEDAKKIEQGIAENNTKENSEVSAVQYSDSDALTALVGVTEYDSEGNFVGVDSEGQSQILKDLASYKKEDFKHGKQLLKFFYFGDLLESVLEGMFVEEFDRFKSFQEKELRIILGNLTFFDYGQLEDTGQVIRTKGLVNEKYQYERVFTGKRTSVNMADIPISLKTFTSWFINNIVDKKLEKLSFKEFIDKVVNDLLIRAVSTECREFAPRQKARVTYKVFSSPRSEAREKKFEESFKNLLGYRLNLSDIKDSPFVLPQNKVDQQGVQVLDNYMLIYGMVESPFDLLADRDKDRKLGIYHLFYGNEFGIVKNIKFDREDVPYLRETNLHTSLADKSGPAKLLRQKYKATIEMIGNNIFEVGGKLHITPSLMGTGELATRSKALLDLGIGGYYDIISVESVVETGVFKTKLETRWTSRGDGTVNIGDEEIATERATDIITKKNVVISSTVVR